jgi:hypothetical protein
MPSVSDEHEHMKRDKYVSMMNEDDTRSDFGFEITDLLWTRWMRQSWGAWVEVHMRVPCSSMAGLVNTRFGPRLETLQQLVCTYFVDLASLDGILYC